MTSEDPEFNFKDIDIKLNIFIYEIIKKFYTILIAKTNLYKKLHDRRKLMT